MKFNFSESDIEMALNTALHDREVVSGQLSPERKQHAFEQAVRDLATGTPTPQKGRGGV